MITALNGLRVGAKITPDRLRLNAAAQKALRAPGRIISRHILVGTLPTPPGYCGIRGIRGIRAWAQR